MKVVQQMSRPQNNCRTLPHPKNCPLGSQKVKKDPKNKKKTIPELTKTYKMKLKNYISIPKNNCGTLIPTPKIAH